MEADPFAESVVELVKEYIPPPELVKIMIAYLGRCTMGSCFVDGKPVSLDPSTIEIRDSDVFRDVVFRFPLPLHSQGSILLPNGRKVEWIQRQVITSVIEKQSGLIFGFMQSRRQTFRIDIRAAYAALDELCQFCLAANSTRSAIRSGRCWNVCTACYESQDHCLFCGEWNCVLFPISHPWTVSIRILMVKEQVEGYQSSIEICTSCNSFIPAIANRLQFIYKQINEDNPFIKNQLKNGWTFGEPFKRLV